MTRTDYGDMFKATATFQQAKRRLDDARDKLATAQTEFIDAERKYNEASRDYTHSYFSEPERRPRGSAHGKP